jgi:predicted TPR repeat methyltransferase
MVTTVASVFDDKAATWDDDPAKVERARTVAEAVRGAVPLMSSTRLLEYGAGTGLTSQALVEDVGPITLAEPSAGMRAVIARKIEDGALPADARLWNLDLTADPPPDERVDLIVTVLVLHHIRDLDPVLRGFTHLLDDGGHLCIVDLEREDGSFHHDVPDFDGHHGFVRAELGGQLESAGFRDVGFTPCSDLEREGRRYPLFLATCRAGAASKGSGADS